MPDRTRWRRALRGRSVSPDGSHYVLSGQNRCWITNGAIADLSATRCSQRWAAEKFTAFYGGQRAWPGVTPGAEEKKMGLKGSSTTAVYFDNVKVPVENVLGEVGRGQHYRVQHFEPGAIGSWGCSRTAARAGHSPTRFAMPGSARHSEKCDCRVRHDSGQAGGDGRADVHKRKRMASRVVGEIEARMATQGILKAAEEFAVECSLVKIFGSEMLDFVVDEALQIHGGYGYHQDYAVERAYRDARINRIFEGTNEINRLLATGMLLKRAQRGTLPLVAAVKKLQAEILSGPGSGESDAIANSKKIGLLLLGAAYQRFGGKSWKRSRK